MVVRIGEPAKREPKMSRREAAQELLLGIGVREPCELAHAAEDREERRAEERERRDERREDAAEDAHERDDAAEDAEA